MSEESVEEMKPEQDTTTLGGPKKLTKFEQRKQQILTDRMKRHVAAGKTPEQAYAAIQREDYDRMPVDDKVKRLEGMLVGNIQSLSNDVSMLHKNEKDLADVMDVNFRAFERMMVKLGLPLEEQRKILVEVEAELRAELEARTAARATQQRMAEEEAKKEVLATTVDEPGEAQKAPEGATIFGG
jgi:hypothetical protein